MLNCTKNRLRLCTALLLTNILFIWGNSLLPGDLSKALSQSVKDLLEILMPGGADAEESGGIPIRKIAHVAEFCCLGMCTSWLARMRLSKPWQHWVLPLTAAVAVACVDETIQCFTPDRGPALKDVGIDTLGIVLGIVIISLVHYFKKRFGGKQL